MIPLDLTILGGAAACPNPGQGSSSYLLQATGLNLLIDCGPDTLQELRKHVEIDQIDHILISHVHADHTLDLVALRYGLAYAPGLQANRPSLYMPPGGNAYLNGVADAFAMGGEGASEFFGKAFDIREYDPASVLSFEPVRVAFRKTTHAIDCWAMRFESRKGTLVYLADTGPQEDLIEFAREADILICEGTYPDGSAVSDESARTHLTASEAGRLAREAGARKFVLTHLWATAGFDRYIDAATEAYGDDVILARPGVKVSTS